MLNGKRWNEDMLKPRGYIRTGLRKLVRWALFDEVFMLDEAEHRLDTLYKIQIGLAKRLDIWEKEQARLERNHSDWVGECERAQVRHEVFIAQCREQNDILKNIAAAVWSKGK